MHDFSEGGLGLLLLGETPDDVLPGDDADEAVEIVHRCWTPSSARILSLWWTISTASSASSPGRTISIIYRKGLDKW